MVMLGVHTELLPQQCYDSLLQIHALFCKEQEQGAEGGRDAVATALLRLQYMYSGSLEPWLHWGIEVPDCGAVAYMCVCRAAGIWRDRESGYTRQRRFQGRGR